MIITYVLERTNKETLIKEYAVINPDNMELDWIDDFDKADRFNGTDMVYKLTENRCNDIIYKYIILNESDGEEIEYKN